MRILQIAHSRAPRRIAHNGGELRYWQNLASLAALGHEIYLVLVTHDKLELEPDVESLVANVYHIPIPTNPQSKFTFTLAMISANNALKHYFGDISSLKAQITSLAQELKIDLIWADWVESARLLPRGIPSIYSHSDFMSHIRKLRYLNSHDSLESMHWKNRLTLQQLEYGEHKVCKQADVVLCVSDSERKKIQKVNPNSFYIPIVGPTTPKSNFPYPEKGRVFLFGNSSNTALHYTRNHIMNDLWDDIQTMNLPVEWHQVGLIRPNHENRSDIVWQSKYFQVHGFVEDLSTVFRPGDASFVPYAEDTGFRTKFVTAASYGVVNIGYHETFLCAPEFENGVNCLSAGSPEELLELLKEYATDKAFRQRLSEASRQLYNDHFSFESQLSKYEEVVRKAVATRGN